MSYKWETVQASSAKSAAFLYRNLFGRIVLKLLTRPFVSKLCGRYMDSRRSRRLIKQFVQKNKIDLSLYEPVDYQSFNAFFTRKIKLENRPVCQLPNALIAPCDAKLSVYPIDEKSRFCIKNGIYSTAELLADATLAAEFDGGYCLIFRLCVEDYHRYCYFDTCEILSAKRIKGVLHTVQPVATDNGYNIYKQNTREYMVLQTAGFGKAVQMEIGAMLVGKIQNHHHDGRHAKGEEKGLFLYGGSTVVVLLRKDTAVLDKQLIENTNKGLETVVKYGEQIGAKK